MEDEIRPKALIIPFDKFVILEILPPEQCKNVIMQMRDYVQHGKEPENLEAIEQIAFESMRSFMDEAIKNYRKTIDVNRENGKKGGRPRKELKTDGFSKKPKETDGFSKKTTETHENPNLNLNLNQNLNQNLNLNLNPTDATASEKEKKEKAAALDNKNFDEIIRHYEQAIGSFPRSALEKLQKWRQVYSTEMVLLAIDKASEAGKHSWSYVNGILSGWQRNNIRTPEEAAAADERHTAQRAMNAPQRRNVPVSRSPEEAAKAGNFLADAGHRRPLRKKGEQQNG